MKIKIFTLSILALMLSTLSLTGQSTEVADGSMQMEGDSLESRVERIRSLAAYRDSLTMTSEEQLDSMTIAQGVVTISEDISSRSALAKYESQPNAQVIDGYRVGVYFNNSAQARSGAMAVVRRCDTLFADIPSTMSYDNPYFKVSLGYCINEEEAVMMLNRVQRHFPKAYLLRERISVDDIIRARTLELKSQSTPDSLSL